MPTVQMTAKWLEQIKAPKGERVEWFDEKVTGLGIRVSATGRKVWFVRYRPSGTAPQRRLLLDTYPGMSLSEARAKAMVVLSDKTLRNLEPSQQTQEGLSIEALASEFIERYSKPRKRSWRGDQQILVNHVLPTLGKRQATELRRRDVVHLLDKICDLGIPTQANRTLAVLRKLYNWAISRDIVQSNPCTQVQKPAIEVPRDRVLSPAEIRAIWKSLDHQFTTVSAVFKILLLTGQRLGEVLSMRWVDVDMPNRIWTIPGSVAKNGLSHRVPLSELAAEVLSSLESKTCNSPWVFGSRKRKGKRLVNIAKPLDQVRQNSGVAFRLHDLRRTAASHMTSMGIARLVVSKILNHVEPGITRVYDRYSYDKEKRDALDLWAQRLTQIMG